MKIATLYRPLASITVFLGVAMFAAAEPSPTLLTLTAAVLIGVGLARAAGKETNLPRNVINLLVLAVIANAFFEVLIRNDGQTVVENLTRFLVFLQLIKLFDIHRARDDAQVLALSLFVAIGAMLTSVTFVPGLLLICYMPLAVVTAMALQLHIAQDRAIAPLRGARPEPAVLPSGSGRGFFGLSVTTLLASIVIATVLFLIAPRGLGDNFLGSFGSPVAGETQIGFNDKVLLGSDGFLRARDSLRPVLKVAVQDAQGLNAVNATQAIHLRGTALNAWNPETRTWYRDDAQNNPQRLTIESGRTLDISEYDQDRTASLTYTVQVQSPIGYLFTSFQPVALTPVRESIQTTAVADDLVFPVRSGLQLPAGAVYEFRSIPPGLGKTDPVQSPPTYSNPRVAELAHTILADAELPANVDGADRATVRRAANALNFHLQQEYMYTLEMRAPRPGLDPIESFLFEHKQGHCEYFASAMVALCQSVGIPARLVTGYLVTEVTDDSTAYLVRESDAHAWAEVQIAPGVWTTYDPSPPGDIDRIHRGEPGLVASIQRWYRSLELSWALNVVGFDEQRQSEILGESFVRNIGSFIPDPDRPESDDTSAALRWGVTAAGFAAFGTYLLRRRAKRKAPGRSAHRGLRLRRTPPDADFFNELERLLARSGHPRPAARPPLRHAASLQDSDLKHLTQDAGTLTDLYYQLRFGGARLTTNQREQARTTLDRLRLKIRAT